MRAFADHTGLIWAAHAVYRTVVGPGPDLRRRAVAVVNSTLLQNPSSVVSPSVIALVATPAELNSVPCPTSGSRVHAGAPLHLSSRQTFRPMGAVPSESFSARLCRSAFTLVGVRRAGIPPAIHTGMSIVNYRVHAIIQRLTHMSSQMTSMISSTPSASPALRVWCPIQWHSLGNSSS